VVDRVVAVIRRHVLADQQPSAWTTVGRTSVAAARIAGLVLLYCLRFALAAPETARGLRRMVLAATPLPAPPEAPQLRRSNRPVLKKAISLALYRAHPDYGDRRGLDRDTYHAQLADLRQWADTVLRQHYGGYELRECWPRHIHAIWELSTLAAEWHRTYSGTRPNLARALEFYDRWLPGAMRRITGITRTCLPQCATLRSPGDWAARPRYR